MNGWKFRLPLGALVIAVAVGVVALIDHHGSGRVHHATAHGTTPKLTQLERNFDSFAFTRSGGIAGLDDSVRIDSTLHVVVTSHGHPHHARLTTHAELQLLRALERRSHGKQAGSGSSAAPSYPDQLHQQIQFVWKGKPYAFDEGDPNAADVIGVMDDLLSPTKG